MEYFWSSYKSKRSSSETCFEEDKNCQHQHQNEQVIVGNIIINERENQHCHHHHHTQYHYKEEYQITLMDPRPYFMRLSLIQYQHRSLYHIQQNRAGGRVAFARLIARICSNKSPTKKLLLEQLKY